ncbi:TPA: cytochrome P450 [Bacillus cereus]|uniref:Cytochrome P450 n=2 Tax=Bacillus cereus group TaxID=86661 RepID=A0ABD7DPC8_BACCE|nr:cytochrome P450 [Bacillus sp. CR71]AXR23352.1 cytochrome P450 [Bacillus sp. E25]AZV66915.1 cytochrome P450 [Bacillus cereus]KAA0784842.1 cytochrome P450 [Bacillus sp. BB56-3]KAA0827896.1 cytochrome P450 [Bacillus sp. AY2-1]KAA8488769.1 cytochrome P450 [Bacillus thuringiensis]MBG0968077.1 cytochrome P450 [Bacillus sp. SRB3LM]NVO37397.1 cytochrome P450 [Bacillus thuringiensis serovar israelensis]NYS73201.1 cytochrome P450 [Bacillus sp. BH32]RUR62198.1 cytochrome P450 [Bacillus sp. VKPM B-
METLLNEKRLNPDSDLINDLIQTREQENKLNKNELLSTIWLFIIAGHETTVNYIEKSTSFLF